MCVKTNIIGIDKTFHFWFENLSLVLGYLSLIKVIAEIWKQQHQYNKVYLRKKHKQFFQIIETSLFGSKTESEWVLVICAQENCVHAQVQ